MSQPQSYQPPPQPELVYRHPVPQQTLLPAFPMVAQAIDHQAQRIPWWGWLVLGGVAYHYLWRRRRPGP